MLISRLSNGLIELQLSSGQWALDVLQLSVKPTLLQPGHSPRVWKRVYQIRRYKSLNQLFATLMLLKYFTKCIGGGCIWSSTLTPAGLTPVGPFEYFT